MMKKGRDRPREKSRRRVVTVAEEGSSFIPQSASRKNSISGDDRCHTQGQGDLQQARV